MNEKKDIPTERGGKEAILRAFSQVMADPQRLKIAGRLAVHPHSLVELGESLQIPVEQLRDQMEPLLQMGLVRLENERFAFNEPAIAAWAEIIHAGETRDRGEVVIETADAFERKVLRDFLHADGSIKAFPVQEKKFLVLVRYTLQVFEPGVQYTEKQVNELLRRYHLDTALLRRAMIDHGYMARQAGIYWLLDS